jgi:hypothetical protein
MATYYQLDFEKPIVQLEQQIDALEQRVGRSTRRWLQRCTQE